MAEFIDPEKVDELLPEKVSISLGAADHFLEKLTHTIFDSVVKKATGLEMDNLLYTKLTKDGDKLTFSTMTEAEKIQLDKDIKEEQDQFWKELSKDIDFGSKESH